MDVSDILRDRMQEPGGLTATALVSLLVHGAVLAGLVVGPMRWVSNAIDQNKPVMTITLGGAGTGPQNGGLTSIGARAVQTTEPAPKPEALRAPAAQTPPMTIPLANTAPPAKPVKAPPKETQDVAKNPDARGTTLSRGEQIQTGPAVAVTGAKGQGFGLSTGGGKGLGSTLDVGDFCCPDYIALMQERVRTNWNQQAEVSGAAVIKFTVQRDGRLTDTTIERTSGYAALDNAARRAIEITRQITPLPSGYPNPTLTIHLTFQY